MKEEYGGLLHKQIPLDNRDNLRIADIGTGTGQSHHSRELTI